MEWVELGELVEIRKGKKLTETLNKENSVRMIMIEDLRDNSNLKYTEYDEKNIFINKNDIVIAWDGANAGTIGYNLDGVIGSTLAKLSITKEGINSKYLGTFLQSKFNEIRDNCTGATIPHVSKSHLIKLKIPVPPIQTQKQIVEVLDEARKLIDTRKEQIKLLDNLIESIFYDMFGDPVKNDKGWEVKKFDSFSNVRSSKRVYISDCVNEGIPFFRGTEIAKLSSGQEANPELFITEEHYKLLKEETGVPKIGDLLLPSICSKGEVWMVDTNEPFYFKDGRVLWIELGSSNINGRYLQYCFSQVLLNNFEGIASGSTFPELKIFIIKKLEIPIPPISLQNQFAQKVEQIESQKQQMEQSLKLMEDNYNNLMQRAFRGELF